MERKADIEYKQLCKIGVPENLAYLIVCHKYKVNLDTVEDTLNDVKEQQKEFAESIKDFMPLEETIKFVELEKNANLISNININKDDQNKDKDI